MPEQPVVVRVCPFCSCQDITVLPETTLKVSVGNAQLKSFICENEECASRQFKNHAIVVLMLPTDI